ncbi:MAG: hypothetical protein PHW04_08215 [Candidatus Wallbacteria bacterium]|nr:hypothetical protein [Candidatus Wallbacteria bacterium]
MNKKWTVFFLILYSILIAYLYQERFNLINRSRGYAIPAFSESESLTRTMLVCPELFPQKADRVNYQIWEGDPGSWFGENRFSRLLCLFLILLTVTWFLIYLKLFREVMLLNLLSLAAYLFCAAFILLPLSYLAKDQTLLLYAKTMFFILCFYLAKNLAGWLHQYPPGLRAVAVLPLVFNLIPAYLFFIFVTSAKPVLLNFETLHLQTGSYPLALRLPERNGRFFMVFQLYNKDSKLDSFARQIDLTDDMLLTSSLFSMPVLGCSDQVNPELIVRNLTARQIGKKLKFTGDNIRIYPQEAEIVIPPGESRTLKLNLIPSLPGTQEISIDCGNQKISWPVFVSYPEGPCDESLDSGDFSLRSSWEKINRSLQLILEVTNKNDFQHSFTLVLPELPGLKPEHPGITRFGCTYLLENSQIGPNNKVFITIPYREIIPGTYKGRKMVIFMYGDTQPVHKESIKIPDYMVEEACLDVTM